jgi:Tfp pilus assembly protein PilP
MMAGWSPLTKILLLIAVLAVPYLLWTMSEETPGVAQARRESPLGATTAAIAAESAEMVEPRSLPPLQTFAAVVERPLFTPSRRLVRPVEITAVEPEPEPEAQTEEGSAEAETEPEEEPVTRPDLRFFGTVRRGREITALVTREGVAELARLGMGDAVDEWKVTSVDRDRLVLTYENEEAVYRIFGSGEGGKADTGGGGAAGDDQDEEE